MELVHIDIDQLLETTYTDFKVNELNPTIRRIDIDKLLDNTKNSD
ncbi:hypothetical protein PY093_16050 [Cytobacillus sp. S13-E01]|nr:hypothetical protein [Cytobacillus sp. S13-E01]MDF0728178.1 hypothetical protein [Cytobacillus sp. S13-E01]